MSNRLFLLLLVLFLSIPELKAAEVSEEVAASDLTDVPIERLIDIEVISAAKRPQRLSDASAAIYVITAEDLRRSGHTTVMEALRMAPGLHVGQVGAGRWAISSRGFSGVYNPSLLVLIDGRSIHSPISSGVFWDMHDIPTENIERIEVIRGPGASLWGHNAVNGVINIITKRALETEGWQVNVGGGNEERGFGGVRYGGAASDAVSYRAYAQYANRDNFTDTAGRDAGDAWMSVHGGTRWDAQLSDRDQLSIWADGMWGDGGELNPQLGLQTGTAVPADRDSYTADLMTEWRREFSTRSDLALKFYYDRSFRQEAGNETFDTLDLDLQHHLKPWEERIDLIYGADYRLIMDELTPAAQNVTWSDFAQTNHLITGFAQGEVQIIPDRFRLIAGTKVERHYYSGLGVMPTGRLLWTPHPDHTVWAAVSRALRAPSRAERTVITTISVDTDPTSGLQVFSTTQPVAGVPTSEVLLGYEAGYRFQWTERVSVDLAGFLNYYDRMVTISPGTPTLDPSTTPAHIDVPLLFGNLGHGNAKGGEAAAEWQLLDRWKVAGSYSFLDIDLAVDAGSPANTALGRPGDDPRHQFQVRSYLNLPYHLEFDSAVYFVDRLTTVPRYTRVDARLGWKPVKNLELSAVGQNLFDRRHPESTFFLVNSTEVDRSFYGRLTWQF